ncbi:CheR family methyltransferase [Cupriavidus basilensis]
MVVPTRPGFLPPSGGAAGARPTLPPCACRGSCSRTRGCRAAAHSQRAPCSTGEEPYSIVMALLDAGVPEQRFQVDAVDISARSLERARIGQYGSNSFRGSPLDFRDRHFTASAGGYTLKASVRAKVRLLRGNPARSGPDGQ